MTRQTFKQFLVEEEPEGPDSSSIIKNCSQYIKEIGDVTQTLLFRGMQIRNPEGAIYKQIRKDRQPRDAPPPIHRAMDQWFKQNYNVRFRSNSIQASGDRDQTEEYGNVYAIFPVDGYKYIYADGIPDFGQHFEDRLAMLINKVDPEDYGVSSTDELLDRDEIPDDLVNQTFEGFDLRTTDLKHGIHSGSEIMISGKGFYAIPAAYNEFDQSDQKLEDMLQSIQQAAKKRGLV